MRLGKEEARGFIEEPAEISATQHDPTDTELRTDAPPKVSDERAPQDTPEDQPASTR